MCCSAAIITRLSTVSEKNIETIKEAMKKKADFEKDELFNRLYTATDVQVFGHNPVIS